MILEEDYTLLVYCPMNLWRDGDDDDNGGVGGVTTMVMMVVERVDGYIALELFSNRAVALVLVSFPNPMSLSLSLSLLLNEIHAYTPPASICLVGRRMPKKEETDGQALKRQEEGKK